MCVREGVDVKYGTTTAIGGLVDEILLVHCSVKEMQRRTAVRWLKGGADDMLSSNN